MKGMILSPEPEMKGSAEHCPFDDIRHLHRAEEIRSDKKRLKAAKHALETASRAVGSRDEESGRGKKRGKSRRAKERY
jgi:hypothetical protein